jgi:hypothetical protein
MTDDKKHDDKDRKKLSTRLLNGLEGKWFMGIRKWFMEIRNRNWFMGINWRAIWWRVSASYVLLYLYVGFKRFLFFSGKYDPGRYYSDFFLFEKVQWVAFVWVVAFVPLALLCKKKPSRIGEYCNKIRCSFFEVENENDGWMYAVLTFNHWRIAWVVFATFPFVFIALKIATPAAMGIEPHELQEVFIVWSLPLLLFALSCEPDTSENETSGIAER